MRGSIVNLWQILEALALLTDPVRRSAYQVVADAGGEPVGRDEVAAALGVGRTLAAFHLDKLVDAGLLEASFARRTGRSGPGAGRPAKLYRRAAGEHVVSVPPRAYLSAAELLAEGSSGPAPTRRSTTSRASAAGRWARPPERAPIPSRCSPRAATSRRRTTPWSASATAPSTCSPGASRRWCAA